MDISNIRQFTNLLDIPNQIHPHHEQLNQRKKRRKPIIRRKLFLNSTSSFSRKRVADWKEKFWGKIFVDENFIQDFIDIRIKAKQSTTTEKQ